MRLGTVRHKAGASAFASQHSELQLSEHSGLSRRFESQALEQEPRFTTNVLGQTEYNIEFSPEQEENSVFELEANRVRSSYPPRVTLPSAKDHWSFSSGPKTVGRDQHQYQQSYYRLILSTFPRPWAGSIPEMYPPRSAPCVAAKFDDVSRDQSWVSSISAKDARQYNVDTLQRSPSTSVPKAFKGEVSLRESPHARWSD